jgi:predicted  nucleic acid-binding Zn-ribbon protein
MVDNNLKELKDLVTDIRICMAKLEAQQSAFANSLQSFQSERLKTYDAMTDKIITLEKEVKALDKKISYAAGAITAASAFFSLLSSAFLKKIGFM